MDVTSVSISVKKGVRAGAIYFPYGYSTRFNVEEIYIITNKFGNPLNALKL